MVALSRLSGQRSLFLGVRAGHILIAALSLVEVIYTLRVLRIINSQWSMNDEGNTRYV